MTLPPSRARYPFTLPFLLFVVAVVFADAHAPFARAASLVLGRAVSPNSIVAGQPITYTYTVSNTGPASASAVQLYLAVGSFSSVITTAAVSQGTVELGFPNGAVFDLLASFGNLPANTAATLTLQAIPVLTGTIGDLAHLYADGGSTPTAITNGSVTSVAGPGVLVFGNGHFTGREDSPNATITVVRHGGAIGSVSVQFDTASLEAIAGQDYIATNGTLSFANGETNKTITVPLREDGAPECNETLAVRIFSPTGGAVLVQDAFFRTNATLLIADNDSHFPGSIEGVSARTNAPLGMGNADSYYPFLTTNGVFVAFVSRSTNLTTDPLRGSNANVFLQNLTNRTTVLLSKSITGSTGANGDCAFPAVSANGRYVVFESEASNLVANDANGQTDIFLRDTVSSTTQLLSVNNAGTVAANGGSFSPRLTPDGRYVVFGTRATDLIPGKTSTVHDLVLRDLVAGTKELVSVTPANTGGNGDSFVSSMTDDGRFIAFDSTASNLHAADASGSRDVFVRDRLTGTNILCSISTNGQSGNGVSIASALSGDGRLVVFDSSANNLAPLDQNALGDVFVYDVMTGSVRLVSINRFKTNSGRGSSYSPTINRNGRYVVFYSTADDLVPNDLNGQFGDFFVHDLVTSNTVLVTMNCAGTGSGNDAANAFFPPGVSADGRFVTFESRALDLVAGEVVPNRRHVYRRDLVAGTTELVSWSAYLTGTGNRDSFEPVISADGSRIVFTSSSTNLVLNDRNNANDVFVWRSTPPAANPSLTLDKATVTPAVVRVTGTPGALYQIQRTTNLATPTYWTPLHTTNAPTNGVIEFIDNISAESATYRARRP